MYLVFDIGATHARLALSSDGQNLEQVAVIDTDPAATGFDAVVEAAIGLARGTKVRAVAGGIAGQIDANGRLDNRSNLTAWTGTAVADRLKDALDAPVLVRNDVFMAGLGEATRGAGREHGSVVYFTVSTGINGVRIVNGVVEPKADGFEIGQQLMMDDRGQLATLEQLTGGASLERKYGRSPRELDDSVWRLEAKYLARGIYNTLLHWPAEVVVLGGSMMRDIEVGGIEAELAKLPKVFGMNPVLKLAELGSEAGLYGALELLSAAA